MPVSKEWLKNSKSKQHSRGPDAKCDYVFRNIGIALNMFSLSGNARLDKQPYISQTGDTICILDGDIFNFSQLMKNFDLPTKKNASSVIVELYEKIGIKFVDQFRWDLFDHHCGQKT